MSLDALFKAQSVAVIGSMAPGKLGAVVLKQVLDGNYAGALYAVNPKSEGAYGVAGYASVSAIGERVDLAIISSPAPTVAGVLEDCGRAGVRAAVIITSGFAETGNQAGEDEILRVARQHNIRFVGPNCAGIGNTGARLFPMLEIIPPAGGVALMSQSGALGGVVLGWAEEQGLGISKFVSYGNGADLGQEELLRYLASDPETKVVALYIESVRDGRGFMDALAECARVKPVVVIKAGRTSVGQRATASHTGSMAGADAVYDAAIRQSGAIRVHSVAEMVDTCTGFVSLPPVRGQRVIIVTNSGGPGVLAADHAEEIGLHVAEPSSGVKDELRKFLPGHCSLRNPIDLTVEGDEAGYRRTLQAVLGEYDAAVAMNVSPSYLDSLGLARGVVDAAREAGKPVVANFIPNKVVAESVAWLQANNIPNYPSGERAVETLAQMARYQQSREGRQPGGTGLSLTERGRRLEAAPQRLPVHGQMLEPVAMAWLRQNGIAVPDFNWAQEPDDAVKAAAAIGYPVVIKVVSPGVLHKSDVGGVAVGVRDADEVRQAFEKMRLAAQDSGFRGVVVYPMVRGAVEALVGLTRDAQFGPVVAFGLGGIYTEIWRDIALRVGPVDFAEAARMIREIKGFKLLQGARGSRPRDLKALAELLVKFSELPFRYPEIAEADLNPVFLLEDGLLVGDVRIIR